MAGEPNQMSVVFPRKLRLLGSPDPVLREINEHIRYMEEQLEVKIRALERKNSALERRIKELESV